MNNHPFHLKFIAFCPKFSWKSWVEFQEKTIPGEFFRNFVQTKAVLNRNLWNSGLISAISFRVRIALKKNSHRHFRMLFAPRQGGTSINESQKQDPGRKARTFCFWKIGFVHFRFAIYYTLLLGYFVLKFLPDILHCFYWVLHDVWAPDSSHNIGKKSFIRHCQSWKEGSFVCETGWYFSWVITHPFDLKFVPFCPKFSGDSWVEFQEKTILGEFFRNFVQTKTILYRNLWNSGLISAISIWVHIALKKIHTGTFVCCLHPGKEPRP